IRTPQLLQRSFGAEISLPQLLHSMVQGLGPGELELTGAIMLRKCRMGQRIRRGVHQRLWTAVAMRSAGPRGRFASPVQIVCVRASEVDAVVRLDQHGPELRDLPEPFTTAPMRALPILLLFGA